MNRARPIAWLPLTFGAVALTAALLLTAACSNAPSSQPPTVAPRSASLPTPTEDGRDIFLTNCTGCHGRDADSDTPAGRLWHVPQLRSAAVQQTTDAQLLTIMRKGKGKMPGWGNTLSAIDLAHLLAYLRSLKPLSSA